MKSICGIILASLPAVVFSQFAHDPLTLRRSDSFFGVHFDLHASEEITDAGRTLTYAMLDTFLSRVKPDFVQIDCKGHPGIASYPSKTGFHVKGFEKDPLKLWREVTLDHHVALYMHYSGILDYKVATEYPGWAVVQPDGKRSMERVSFFSPYLDSYMIPQLKELSREYGVNGAWIDGECWALQPDYGEASLNRFRKETGITLLPKGPSDAHYPELLSYTRSLFRENLQHYVDSIHQYDPSFQITSNWAYSSLMPEKPETDVDFLSGDVTPQNGVYRSSFEARCLAPQGKPWDLMAWGFSWNGGDMPMGIKSAIQLKQEAAEIIAMGGGVQFYFQQNNDLSIKPWIADMLADIGSFSRARQPFCHKATAIPQIALLYPTASYMKNASVAYSFPTDALQGCLYALLDAQLPVEIRMEHNLTGRMNQFPLIIIPGCNYLDPAFLQELRSYVTNGGKLLVIGSETAGLFAADLGIQSAETVPIASAFISADHKIGSVRSELLKVQLDNKADILSRFYTGSDFREVSSIVAASSHSVGKGMIAACYFDAGTAYREYKTPIIRDFLAETVRSLFPDPVVEVQGSHLVHVAVNALDGKLMISLINTAGEHANQAALGYDEIPPLHHITVRITLPEKPAGVTLQPEGKPLQFTWRDGAAVVTLEEVKIHEILEIF